MDQYFFIFYNCDSKEYWESYIAEEFFKKLIVGNFIQ